MPHRGKNVWEVCEHSHSSQIDRRGHRLCRREYSEPCMTEFEAKVSSLRGPGKYFSAELPVYISRAPGRLDLMGGNVDYTGGLVFQATIREATWAAVQLREDSQFEFSNPQLGQRGWRDRVAFSLDDLASE